VLIVVPPSESKRPPPEEGHPVSLDELSFPALTERRGRLMDALIETSAAPDAFARLYVRPTKAGEVVRNLRLRELPTLPVLDVYTGPLHGGLDAASFSPATASRAADDLVVVSPLWGLLRPADRIPPYRMHPCARLIDIDDLGLGWRPILSELLADVSDPDGLMIDLRSPMLQAFGMPTGFGGRTVVLRVDQAAGGGRRIGDVVAKRVRGEAARHLLDAGTEPGDPDALADVLAERWPVRLAEPAGPGAAWTLTLTAAD
jgi:cytoplasmic iron level regulating protein YaaA (DUF328/UPF0246 family)